MKHAPLLAAALATLLPLAVVAQTRHATGSVRMRAEPRPTAALVTTIPAGAAVQVSGCGYGGGSWCAVEYSGRSGYAAERRLSTGNADVAVYDYSAAGTRPRATAPRRPVRRAHRSSASRSSRRPERSGGGRSSASSRGYYTGPRGGCYTYTASGRKRYVDHSYCY
ncbi:MAG TPA: SH3 domain-containing protein [Longimicrobium sp.]|nr:SH3 domain-containing protein [Longimicrobium sp.]